MKSYMPEFKSEKEFNDFMNSQSKKIPRDKNGMATFDSPEHFLSVLENLGIENPVFLNDSTITGIVKE